MEEGFKNIGITCDLFVIQHLLHAAQQGKKSLKRKGANVYMAI